MNKKSDRPILVYRFSSLGDIAMTVPVLRSFFNSYPNQKIVFVSRPYASPSVSYTHLRAHETR